MASDRVSLFDEFMAESERNNPDVLARQRSMHAQELTRLAGDTTGESGRLEAYRQDMRKKLKAMQKSKPAPSAKDDVCREKPLSPGCQSKP